MKAIRCLLFALALPGAAAGQALKPVIRTLVPADTLIMDLPAAESPSGRLIAYRAEADLLIYNRSTGKSTPTRLGRINDYAWSPNGDRITFTRRAENGSAQHIWVADVNPNTGVPVQPARRVTMASGRSPRFAPDGQAIAFIRVDSTAQSVILVAPNGGHERVLHRGAGSDSSPLQWSPDGNWIYFMARASAVRIPPNGVDLLRVSVTGGKPEAAASPFPGAGGFLGVSADGRMAASFTGPSGNPGSAMVLRTLDAKTIGIVDLTPELRPKRWSSVGPKLIGIQDVLTSAVFAIDQASGNVRSFSGDWGQDLDPQFSPDGRSAAYVTVVNGRRRLVLTDANGRNRRVLQNTSEPMGQVRWSPDSRYLAFVGGELPLRVANNLTVLDVRTGEQKKLGSAPPRASVIWRKDGKALVRLDRAGRDSVQFVDVDLEGGVTILHGLRGGPERTSAGPIQLLDDEWLALYTPAQIELRSLRDHTTHVVQRGPRSGNANLNNIRAISPDGKTVVLNVQEETSAGRKWVTRMVPIRGGMARY